MLGNSPNTRLLETMKVEGGRIALLERHMARLMRSADALHFSININAIRRYIKAAVAAQPQSVVARLTVRMDGTPEIQFRPLPPPGLPVWVRLSVLHANLRPDPDDPRLFVKTTAREFYDRAREGLPPEADALIVNLRGEVTETTIANVAVLRHGRWVTPPVECGLLPGVMRAELLARGEIVEAVVRADELVMGETVRCFNAVRGVVDAKYQR
jgi:branched-subunit amino acid aminotransferase/4-amino-4-deoxychorismate lyase